MRPVWLICRTTTAETFPTNISGALMCCQRNVRNGWPSMTTEPNRWRKPSTQVWPMFCAITLSLDSIWSHKRWVKQEMPANTHFVDWHLTVCQVIHKCQFGSGVKVKQFYQDDNLTAKLRDVLVGQTPLLCRLTDRFAFQSCQVNALQLNERQLIDYKNKVDSIEFVYSNYN